MPQSDYEKVIDIFHSEIKDKYIINEELEKIWFEKACADYSLDICALDFDDASGNFKKSNPPITTLGLMITRYYLKQELSRINKLNNIIGKDLQLNSTSQAKTATREEYLQVYYEVEQKLHKQKNHCFG